MDEVVDNESTTCSSDENFSRVESQCKVTTLRDLKKKRQVLLAQKNLILNKQIKSNQNLREMEIEKDCLFSVPKTAAVTNSTSKIIPQVLPLACTAPEPTTSDEEMAQCDTFVLNNFQMKILDLDSTNFKMVGSIENIENQDINNLPYMDMINNQSVLNNDDCDLMDISTNELIDIVSTNLILSENSRATPVLLPAQPEVMPMHRTLNETNNELNINITLSSTPDADPMYTCNVAETPDSQSDGITITCPIADVNCNENSIPATQRNDTLPENQPSTSMIENVIENNDNYNETAYHGDLATNKKRKSKVNKDTRTWKRIYNRDLRMKGEEYLGYRREKKENNKKSKIHHDVFKPARSIKPACDSTFCRKSKLRNCNNIDEDKRKNLFEFFWKTMSWEQRRLFVCSHVTAYDKKQVKKPDSNRSKSLAYFLTIDNERHQVCKKMLLNTLGIKEWFVRYWLKTTNCAMPPPSAVSRNVDRSKKNSDGHKLLQQFLDSLPKMPSHYCRANSSRQYLEPVFQTMAQLYKEYVSKCELGSLKYLSRRVFDNVFLKLNLSLFHPKKDQCDLCCGHKVGNITDAEIAIHRNRKDKARKEKDTDKNLAIEGKYHVFTQDVQSVKLAPCLQASAIYYKTKLCVHNFTMYNLATHAACCYWFDETNGSLEASVFASCIVDQLQSVLNRKLLPVILFSDGCCAQNRNSILSNALLRLSIDKNVIITQKFLEKGHTQMECDSVHSAIECRLKGKEIYLPSQYVNIAKIARDNPMPYESRLLKYSFFTDFSKDLIYKTIRPGRKTGDPTVTDLRVLNYKPDGTIWYSLNFDEPLQPLPQRPLKITNIRLLEELPKLFSERLPISERKYKDLQDLKAVIPSNCHSYYDELPYKN